MIAILDVETDFKIRTIEVNEQSLGQPFWVNDNSIGFVAWSESPRRLGVTYCPIRLSALYTYELSVEDAKPVRISSEGEFAVRNPSVTPEAQAIVYLETESGGPHCKAERLMRYDLQSKATEVLVDVDGVREVISYANNGLKYGKVCSLFVGFGDLGPNSFTSDGSHLLVNCFRELQYILCSIDLKTKVIKEIPIPNQSFRLIAFVDDLIVGVGSSATSFPNVFVGKLSNNSESIQVIDWNEIKVNSNDILKDVSYEKFYIASEDPEKLLTSILVSPKSVDSKPAPTVVVPHGGPHSVFVDTYMLAPILFAKLGLKTLLGMDCDPKS